MAAVGPALEIDDVSKRYGTRWALSRLSYQLPTGASLLLTGHNGSGKTTLLKVLATALSPTAGRVRILGMDSQTDREAVRARVALLSHASYLYEDLSAQQNLSLLAQLLGYRGAPKLAQDLLARVGLGARAHQSIREFSAGMRKRLAIARLLLKAPEVALLDEPFGELDPEGIALVEGLIRGLQQAGTTLVLATHLVEQGERLCQERLHLSQGRRMEP